MSDPVFVYDDDCEFCTAWADVLAEYSDLRIVGFSEVGSGLRERLPADYEECSHLVTDGTVYSCGAAIEEALLRTEPGALTRPMVERLRRCDGYTGIREWGYRLGANNRDVLGTLLSKAPLPKGANRRAREE